MNNEPDCALSDKIRMWPSECVLKKVSRMIKDQILELIKHQVLPLWGRPIAVIWTLQSHNGQIGAIGLFVVETTD